MPAPMLREAIKKQMNRKGWTLYQLAGESGVSYGRLHEWMSGKSESIRSDSADAMLTALGLTVCERRPPHKRKPKP